MTSAEDSSRAIVAAGAVDIAIVVTVTVTPVGVAFDYGCSGAGRPVPPGMATELLRSVADRMQAVPPTSHNGPQGQAS